MVKEDSRTVYPCRGLQADIRVPGDKSISHRAAMLSALAGGVSTLTGFLRSEDCLCTLRAMGALGAGVEDTGSAIRIRGTGGRFTPPSAALDLGNSGTGLRLVAGLLAGQPFGSELTGDASLRSRPMKRIQAPLQEMGAKIELTGERGCAPIRIQGGGLRGIRYALPMASAQVKSAVLLAGLQASGETSVREPRPTRDHTERMLRAMGVTIEVDGGNIRLVGGAVDALESREWDIPGDISSAAFWLAAGAGAAGNTVTVRDVGLNPRRTALLDVLERMGASVRREENGEKRQEAWEPRGTIEVSGAELQGTVIEGQEIPNLIDELPLIAILGAVASGDTEIRDAAELRVKESDRIASVASGLRAMGVEVDERHDGLLIRGGSEIRGGVTIDSDGDHRIAMGFAILGLFSREPVTIHDVACTETSYPGFWEALDTVRGRG